MNHSPIDADLHHQKELLMQRLEKLINLEIQHENIVSLVNGGCETDYEENFFYLYWTQKSVNGSTIKTLSKLTNWTTRLVREVASAVLQALIHLKEHGINPHIVNINESSVLVDENGVWKIVDYSRFFNFHMTSPLVALGDLIESLGVTATEAINFIEKCKYDTSLEELVNHPFIKNLDKSIDDFVVIEEIGKGGFGKVLKAQESKDDQLYAIKCITIDKSIAKNRTLAKAAEEVKTLAKLDNKYVVKYKRSWTEKMKKADYKKYKEDTYEKMDEASNGSTIKPFVFIKHCLPVQFFFNSIFSSRCEENIFVMYIQMEYCGGGTLRYQILIDIYFMTENLF